MCMYILYIYILSELPSLLPVVQLSEALLRLEKGAYLLTRLIANLPDTFDQGNTKHQYEQRCDWEGQEGSPMR